MGWNFRYVVRVCYSLRATMFQNLMTRSNRELELPVSNFSFTFLNTVKLSIFILVELRSLNTSVESGLNDLGRLFFPPNDDQKMT